MQENRHSANPPEHMVVVAALNSFPVQPNTSAPFPSMFTLSQDHVLLLRDARIQRKVNISNTGNSIPPLEDFVPARNTSKASKHQENIGFNEERKKTKKIRLADYILSILKNPLTLKSLSCSDRHSDRLVNIQVDFSQSVFILTIRSRQRLAREPVEASFL